MHIIEYKLNTSSIAEPTYDEVHSTPNIVQQKVIYLYPFL